MVYIIMKIINNFHEYMMSQMMEWCSSYQYMVLTMWICLTLIGYIIFIILLKISWKYFHLPMNLTELQEICKRIEENDVANCISLLNHYPNCINKFTSDGYTPFQIACANGNTQLVKIMLHKGANIKLKSLRGESPFYLATFFYIKFPQFKNATCIRELYYAGANINEPNGKGFTPLQMAAMFGHIALVRWLLHKNASTDVVPNPYLIASSQGHQETAKLIWKISQGSSIEYK